MKYKTTKKAVLENYGNSTIKICYCDAQYLLNYENANAYTCGVYGWGADIYEINGIAIVTGYQPFGVSADYDLVVEYEKKAFALEFNKDLSYEERKQQNKNLLIEFINKEMSRRETNN